jgi:hypothetical protein
VITGKQLIGWVELKNVKTIERLDGQRAQSYAADCYCHGLGLEDKPPFAATTPNEGTNR